MTTKEMKAKPQEISFKLKGVELKPTPDGKDSYKVIVFAPFKGRDGVERISDYPTEMFIHGSELVSAKEMYDWLAKQQPGSNLKLKVAPGKVKQGKQDDGEWLSYFWNLVGVPAIALAQAPQTAPAEDEPLFLPEEQMPEVGLGFIVEPSIKVQSRGESHYDVRERIIGASWAIAQAQAVILVTHPPRRMGASTEPPLTADENEEKDMRRFLADVVNLARRYLAIRDVVASQGPAKKE